MFYVHRFPASNVHPLLSLQIIKVQLCSAGMHCSLKNTLRTLAVGGTKADAKARLRCSPSAPFWSASIIATLQHCSVRGPPPFLFCCENEMNAFDTSAVVRVPLDYKTKGYGGGGRSRNEGSGRHKRASLPFHNGTRSMRLQRRHRHRNWLAAMVR